MPYFTFMNLDWNLKPLPQKSKSGTTPTDVSETYIFEQNIFLNVCWTQNFHEFCIGIVQNFNRPEDAFLDQGIFVCHAKFFRLLIWSCPLHSTMK